MADQSASTPSPGDAVVATTGGRQPLVPVRSSIRSRSRRVSLVPGRSALLITKTSAISSSPALLAWTASPQPGFTTTTVVSAAAATAASPCPTPTGPPTTHRQAPAPPPPVPPTLAARRPPHQQ